MSALIIASHVKEGLEMGRQYTLPQRVLDFIPMHHGTTRIEFFYRKALDQRKEGDPEILESEFRYPGPRPISKETGILMLADSVEAASRSLSDPTHKRLETLIDMIFTARIEDGQIDQTDLTFRELNLIKETFLSLLLGIYHVRVKYPGQEEDIEQEEASEHEEPQRSQTMQDIRDEGVYGTLEQGVRPSEGGDHIDSPEVGVDAEDPSQTSKKDDQAKPSKKERDRTSTEGDDESETARAHREEAERAQKQRAEAAARGAGPESEEEIENRARNAGDGRNADEASSEARPDAAGEGAQQDELPHGQGNGAPPMEGDVASEDEDEGRRRDS